MPAVKGYTRKHKGKSIRTKGHLRGRRKNNTGGVTVPLNNIKVGRVRALI